MKNEELIEFLQELEQCCYITSEPESMLGAYQNAVQALQDVRTRIGLQIDIIDGK